MIRRNPAAAPDAAWRVLAGPEVDISGLRHYVILRKEESFA
jgi:hypothetical protein